VTLNDSTLFNLFIGKRVLKKDLPSLIGSIPLYSANAFKPFGYIEKSNIKDFTHPSILWSIDGNFEFNIVPAGTEFATTDHCGAIQILNPSILPEYLLYALQLQKTDENFDRSFRSSLSNMRQFEIKIPVNEDGTFDIKTQQEIASSFMGANEKKEFLLEIKAKFDGVFSRYVSSSGMLT
jgi:hypothetical protein